MTTSLSFAAGSSNGGGGGSGAGRDGSEKYYADTNAMSSSSFSLFSPVETMEAALLRRDMKRISEFTLHEHVLVGSLLFFLIKPINMNEVGRYRYVLVEGTNKGKISYININSISELATHIGSKAVCPNRFLLTVSGLDHWKIEQKWQIAFQTETEQQSWLVALQSAKSFSREMETTGQARILRDTAQIMCRELQTKSHFHRFHIYERCFKGTDGTAWLKDHFTCSEKNAVLLGIKMMCLGIIHHLNDEHIFSNRKLWFQFRSFLKETNDTEDSSVNGVVSEQLQLQPKNCEDADKFEGHETTTTLLSIPELPDSERAILSPALPRRLSKLTGLDLNPITNQLESELFHNAQFLELQKDKMRGLRANIAQLKAKLADSEQTLSARNSALKYTNKIISILQFSILITDIIIVYYHHMFGLYPINDFGGLYWKSFVALILAINGCCMYSLLSSFGLLYNAHSSKYSDVTSGSHIFCRNRKNSEQDWDDNSRGTDKGFDDEDACSDNSDSSDGVSDFDESDYDSFSHLHSPIKVDTKATTAASTSTTSSSQEASLVASSASPDKLTTKSISNNNSNNYNNNNNNDNNNNNNDSNSISMNYHSGKIITNSKNAITTHHATTRMPHPNLWFNPPILLRRSVDMLCRNAPKISDDLLDPIKIHQPGDAAFSEFKIESDLFVGKCFIIIANLSDSPNSYFRHKKRKSQYVVQGRFKKEIPFASVYSGQVFNEPIEKSIVRNNFLKIVQKMHPSLSSDLSCKCPYLLAPLVNVAQSIVASRPNQEPSISNGIASLRENLNLIGSQFDGLSSTARKKLFSKPANLNGFSFSPDLVYTFNIYQHYLNFSSFQAEFGMLSYDLIKHIGPQPLQLMSIVWDPTLTPEANVRNKQYLFNIEVFHRRSLTSDMLATMSQQQSSLEDLSSSSNSNNNSNKNNDSATAKSTN